MLSFSRLANVSNDIITPRLAEDYSILLSIWTSVLVCILSVFSGLLAARIDKRFANN